MKLAILVFLAQIDVYSGGVYQGRARQSVDCLPPLMCAVSGSGDTKRVGVYLDGGTGGGVTDAKYVVGQSHSGLSAEIAPASDDQIPVSDSSSAATWRSVPNCTDTAGQHLNYTASSNSFSCGTSRSTRSFLSARIPCDQVSPTGPACWASDGGMTASLQAGDHIAFKVVEASNGSDISLNTTEAYTTNLGVDATGRFTLAAGKTYLMRVNVGFVTFASSTCFTVFSWFDTDNALPLGAGTNIGAYTLGANEYGAGTFEAVYTPASQTRVEARIIRENCTVRLDDSDEQSDGGYVSKGPWAFIEVLQ